MWKKKNLTLRRNEKSEVKAKHEMKEWRMNMSEGV